MNFERAKHTLSLILTCAKEAGISEHVFIAFGTLLGAIRPTPRKWGLEVISVQGFMEHDDDIDVGIMADRITPEQEQAYNDALDKYHMHRYRDFYNGKKDNPKRIERRTNGRMLWTSVRPEPSSHGGVKCCNWFMYEWKGFLWHTKGRDWVVNQHKFAGANNQKTDHAMAKGLPASYFKHLIPIEFEGLTVNVPFMYGSALDKWYPGWNSKAKGCSIKDVVQRVPDWDKPDGWRILSYEKGRRY